MAGKDLRALFASNDRDLHVADAFTNREAQWAAVTCALTEQLRTVTARGFDVQDVEAPRDNVVCFHGTGGIGKSTLARRIEASLADRDQPAQWPPLRIAARVLPIRIDLARAAGADLERVVLSLRLAVTVLQRPMPAFDLAFARYWEQAHPGEDLQDYLHRTSSAFARFADAASLPEQLKDTLSDVAQAVAVPGAVVGAAARLASAAARAVRERRSTVRALAGCARLADLLEADPDTELLSYLPHLLAYDLAQVHGKDPVLPVVLLDTFEDTGDRIHRDLERYLQRVVWLMPNVLFVVSGRNRLQWGDQDVVGQLDWTGPAAWPGLAGAGRRQLLVGDFTTADSEDYLARRLTLAGQPLIEANIRAQLAARSAGLPLYLDLAVMRFLEVRRTRTPSSEDFDMDFAALIARTMADLTPEERDALRAAALFEEFSVPLVTAAAGLPQEAAAARLVQRPFVDQDPAGQWRYHLHRAVRTALLGTADTSDDAWSERDWHNAAARAFTALGAEWKQGVPGDRRLLVACLRQGLALARDHRLDLDWLEHGAFAYTADSVWEPLTPPAALTTGPGTDQGPVALLTELLSALARRQHEPRPRTADRLQAVVDAHRLPPALQDMALYYLAKVQRDLGRTRESAAGMRHVLAGAGRYAAPARRGLAHLSRIGGDFPTALHTAADLGWAGRQHRVEGDIHWPNGHFERAARAYRSARTDAEQHRIQGEAATSQAMRALVLAFADPDRADGEIELAEQLLRPLVLRASGLNADLAALARDAGTGPGPDGDVPGRIAAVRAQIQAAGLTQLTAQADLVLVLHHAVRGESTEAAELAQRIHQQAPANGDHAYLAHIASFLAEQPLPDDAHPVTWLDSETAVRERWLRLLQTRRSR
ncbi:ATP/GTP-binding protein [Streptacidiphilus sp. N1-12]|uniref:ATP/GTP-binding protein n=1 Tax=Streptacidiphilus alkalitolerans TaxID=3342712 RepID=A0ABV6WRE4_9ACTN